MALLDYKLVRFSHDKRHVTATLRVYRGAVTTEDERNINGEMVPVTRYRRIATVAERTFEYDVPRDMTRNEFITKARAYFNNKLLTFAQNNGHTVITEQQDTTDLEAVSNETGTL
jgi:hypothetical protein